MQASFAEFADPVLATPGSAPHDSAIPSALLRPVENFMRETHDPFARDAQVVDLEAVRRASMNVQRHSMIRSHEGTSDDTV